MTNVETLWDNYRASILEYQQNCTKENARNLLINKFVFEDAFVDAPQEEKKSNYSELLRNPQWQRKRLEIMGRDDFKCTGCGSSTTMLAVHHKYYERGIKPWEYPDSALTTLCDDCHKDEHGKN